MALKRALRQGIMAEVAGEKMKGPLLSIRNTGRGLLGIFLIWGTAAFSPALVAQQGTRVSLGEVSGPPKGQVMIPFYLTPSPPETQVGSISATIRFDSKAVSFQKAEKSFLLDGVGAGFEVEQEKDPKEPNQSVLHLKVSTQGEPRKPLREGLVLTLVFRIEPEASPGTKVPVVLEKLSAGDLSNPPKAVEPVSSKPGSIEVLSPDQVPFVTCFFFTH